MRGTHVIWCHRRFPPGIIPAHAGNTALTCSVYVCARDHPRACGEHPAYAGLHSHRHGSSPRMRGTLSSQQKKKSSVGIIPAHAGNTSPMLHIGLWSEDHPRACGEHPFVSNTFAVDQGSSPRMRGTHFEISTIPRFLDSFCLFFIQFHFEYFFACRYLLALLHPRRRAPPKDTSFALDGRLTSSNPSQSVGDQSAPCTLNARCCSFLAE